MNRSRGSSTSRPEIEFKEQRLKVFLDAEKECMDGDFARLQQVVWNLPKNASNFTPGRGEISLHTRNTDGRIALEIADSGIGIALETLVRIFERSRRPTRRSLADMAAWVSALLLPGQLSNLSGELHGQSEGKDEGRAL